MEDMMIIAKFNANGYLALNEDDLVQARAQASGLFGSGGNTPSDEVNWIYIGTPAGGEGGWTAIVTDACYSNFSRLLKGPLSKLYDIEVHRLNRTHFNGIQGEANTVATMTPIGSHS